MTLWSWLLLWVWGFDNQFPECRACRLLHLVATGAGIWADLPQYLGLERLLVCQVWTLMQFLCVILIIIFLKKEFAKNRSKWICVSTHTWYLASSKSALPVDLASLANWMPLESLLLVLELSVKSGRERHLLAVDETRLSLDDCWVCKFSTLEVCPDFDKAEAEKAKWQTLWHRRSLGLPLIRGEADLDFRKLRLLKPLPRQHTKGLHKREINDFWTFLDRKM